MRLEIALVFVSCAVVGCAQVTDVAPFATWSELVDDDDAVDDDDVSDDDDSAADDDDSAGDDDDAVGPCDDSFLEVSADTVTLSGDLIPLFDLTCMPCHTIQTRGNMSLTEFNAHDQLVGVLNTLQYEGMNRVEPGDPQASYLMHKIMPCDPSDETWGYQQGPMPPPFPGVKPLTVEQINLVYSWIAQGALDD